LNLYIFVDGREIGHVPGPASNKKDFELPGEGTFDVHFKIQWNTSAVYRIENIKYGECQNLEVEYPDMPDFASVFSWNNFGRLVPRPIRPQTF
jgi:hypothetical protein